MLQYFRCVFFLFLTVWCAQVFALDEVDRFAKKCDLYNEPKSDLKPKVYLKKAKRTLDAANVPIQMLFDECKSIKHLVQLGNSKTVILESGFPTNEDPDSKAGSYTWIPKSPSSQYWFFQYSGWEETGYLLIHKQDGRKIESPCAFRQLSVSSDYVAEICWDGYNDITPTVYLISKKAKTFRRSKPLVIPNCNEYSIFKSNKFVFSNRSTLEISGACRLSETHGKMAVLGKKIVTVKMKIRITDKILVMISDGVTTVVEWDTSN